MISISSIKIKIQVIRDGFIGIKMQFFSSRKDRFGYISPSARIFQPGSGAKQNVYLYENTVIHEGYKFVTQSGKFVMKKNSIAATGLVVISSNHGIYNIGDFPNGPGWADLMADDVIVEEDVWLGANVILCPGVHIQRGVVVAAGSVCIKSNEYPPYSIIGGNPGKFIKYKFSLDQQIEHERLRFAEDERIPVPDLEKYYYKYNK